MGYRSKQKILNRGNPSGWETEKCPTSLGSGNANQTAVRVYHMPNRIVKINTSDSSCCRGCGVRATITYCWWECKLMQQLWKSVWPLLRKTGIHLPQDPVRPLLGTYPKDASYFHRDTCSTTFTAVVFIIARNGKNLDVLQQGDVILQSITWLLKNKTMKWWNSQVKGWNSPKIQ